MFVERSQENGEEKVVLRYAAAFYWLLWPTILLVSATAWLNSPSINIAAGISAVLLFAVAVPYWPIVMQLKRQMRTSSITASGSKYSFSNPLTYRWPVSKSAANRE